jgi:hypothetical protein
MTDSEGITVNPMRLRSRLYRPAWSLFAAFAAFVLFVEAIAVLVQAAAPFLELPPFEPRSDRCRQRRKSF